MDMILFCKNALPLDVPLIVDCGTGKKWLEAH